MIPLTVSQNLLSLTLLIQCAEMLSVRSRIARIWLNGRAIGFTVLISSQAAFALLAFWDARAFPALLAMQILLLARLHGPYAGASDAMTLQVLIAISGAVLLPELTQAFLTYLTLQVALSFFVSGLHKARNRAWWSGKALAQALQLETLDIPPLLKSWTRFPRMLRALGLLILAFELSFPALLLLPPFRVPLFALALVFHAFNAYAFGLNRFFWAWLAAYAAVLALPLA